MSCAVVGGFQQLLEMGWFDEKGLCGHLGLGVHHLEAGLLPCNAPFHQVPELLRQSSQLCWKSTTRFGVCQQKSCSWAGWRKHLRASSLPLRRTKPSSISSAFTTLCGDIEIRRFLPSIAKAKQARSGVVSIASQSEMRLAAADRFPGGVAASRPVRL